MQKFIARLIDCGMPRITAVYICNSYRRKGQMRELAEYVAAVEEETREQLDDL